MSPTDILEPPALAGGGGPAAPRDPARDDGGERPSASPRAIARFGVWLMLGTMSMMFIGFTSSYMVRRIGADWRPIPLPGILWVNTLALLASSVVLELARRSLAAWDLRGAQRWLGATGILGLLFAGGQMAAWRVLASLGVFLASNPHSSFFYMLTGVHLVHLAGGLAWFAVTYTKLRRLDYAPGDDGLGLFAVYWHFVGGLWAYLLLLLYVL